MFNFNFSGLNIKKGLNKCEDLSRKIIYFHRRDETGEKVISSPPCRISN